MHWYLVGTIDLNNVPNAGRNGTVYNRNSWAVKTEFGRTDRSGRKSDVKNAVDRAVTTTRKSDYRECGTEVHTRNYGKSGSGRRSQIQSEPFFGIGTKRRRHRSCRTNGSDFRHSRINKGRVLGMLYDKDDHNPRSSGCSPTSYVRRI